jgi:hypothetical protein
VLVDGRTTASLVCASRETHKTTDGQPDVITLYASTVKDARLTTQREYEITEFVAPSRSAWAAHSTNLVSVRTGGYDLEPDSAGGPRLRVWNELEGHGAGKVLSAPRAAIGARAPAISCGQARGRGGKLR